MRDDAIGRAIQLAAEAHAGQTYGDMPYIWHPLQVGRTLQGWGVTDDLVVAGILHDTIEDTDVTEQMVRDLFGSKVADHVVALTHVDGVAYETYLDGIPDPTVPVKLADALANFRESVDGGRASAKKAAKYAKALVRLWPRVEGLALTQDDYDYTTLASQWVTA